MHFLQIVVLLGWLVCVGICLSVVYGPYTDKDLSHIFTMEQSIAYHSLSRTGWGIAICWIVFACATGYGGMCVFGNIGVGRGGPGGPGPPII